MMIIILSLLVIFLMILLRFRRKIKTLLRHYRLSKKIPGPRGLPLIGSGLIARGSAPQIFNRLIEIFHQYPGLGKIWLGLDLVYFVTKPEYFEIILNHPGAYGKSAFYRPMRSVGGDGLFCGPVPIWKRHRKLLAPTFNQKILNHFIDPITAQIELTIQKLKETSDQTEVDIFTIISNCILGINFETIFGNRGDNGLATTNYGRIFEKYMDILFVKMLKIWYQNEWIFRLTKLYEEEMKCVREIDRFTRKGQQQQNADEKLALLPKMMALNFKNPATFSLQEIRDETNTFLVVGSDTSATCLCFTYLLLGFYQNYQEQLYREVVEILGPNRHVTINDLPHLQFTERVLKESLRIFPVAALIGRHLDTDLELDQVILPRGAQIILVFLQVQRDPKYWPRSLDFNPDRFLPEEMAKRHAYSSLPFSAGPRNCIGNKLAMITMKCILAETVRKFKFFTNYKSVASVELKMGVVMKPKDGYQISLQLR